MAINSTVVISIGLVVLFYVSAILFFYKNRKNIQVQSKIVFLYKTNRGINFIRRLANRFPRFWQLYGYLGILAGVIGMFVIFAVLAVKVAELIMKPSLQPVVQLVLPGPSTFSIGPVMFISIWYFIISVFVILLVHESSHGVVAESFGVKLKSAGVGLAAILPLAFVELSEKKLNKRPLKQQLAVYAAGSFGNFCTALLAVLLSIFLVAPGVAAVTTSNGVYVNSVVAGFPAEQAGLEAGDIITAIDGKPVENSEDIVNILSATEPGQVITVTTSSGDEKKLTVTESPNETGKPYVGLQFKSNIVLKPEAEEKFGKLPWALVYLIQLLYWLFVLNLGIGIINLLPLGPLDGGKMVKSILDKGLKKELALKVFSVISMASLFLLLFSLIGPYLISVVV